MGAWIRRKHRAGCAIAFALALFALLLMTVPALAEETLRVKLTRLGAPSQIQLAADCTYRLADDAPLSIPSGSVLTVTAEGDALALALDGQTAATGRSLRLIREGSGHQGMAFSSPALSNRFCGDLDLTASSGVITAVVAMDVEDYLCGVVSSEMAPSSGFEALKAQAVVARNYALSQKTAHAAAAWDVTDFGGALTFRGYSSDATFAEALKAVEATRGQILCYQGSPATCFFCESNGGQTESSKNAYGVPLPYSLVMDDPYDLQAGPNRTAALNADASGLAPRLLHALREGAAQQLQAQRVGVTAQSLTVAAIRDIAPAAPRHAEPSRLYGALNFTLAVAGTDASGKAVEAAVNVTVPTYDGLEDWYDLSLNEEDNETVSVERVGQDFRVTFRRRGSGVGLSRRGAAAMAKKGLNCETILDYYYPGTALTALSEETQGSPSADQAARLPIATARLSQRTHLMKRAEENGEVVNTLPAGASLTVYAVHGEWAAVRSGDLHGFVTAGALTAFALEGSTPTQVLDETFARISDGPAQLLQLPVDTAQALETLSAGDSVVLNAYTDTWAMVTSVSGREGYLPRQVLTLAPNGEVQGDVVTAQEDLYALLAEDAGLYINADDSVPPRETLKAGQTVQIIAYSSAWASVRTDGGASGYVKLSALSALEKSPAPAQESEDATDIVRVKGKETRYVAVDTLPLYRTHSTDAQVLMTLSRGEAVQLGAYNDTWACVRVNGVTGFMLQSGLSDLPVNGEDPADPEGGAVIRISGTAYATVTQDNAPMYATWDDAQTPVALLDADTLVQVGAYNEVWACVRLNGATGFVHVDALSAAFRD